MSVIDRSTDFGQRAENRLSSESIIWLTTVHPDGRPQPSPVWFQYENDTVLIYSQAGKPKVRNIEANPAVALSFNTTPSGEDVVIFSGNAEIDASAPSAENHSAFLEKYRGGIAGLGMTPESFSAEFSVPIRVTLKRLRGF